MNLNKSFFGQTPSFPLPPHAETLAQVLKDAFGAIRRARASTRARGVQGKGRADDAAAAGPGEALPLLPAPGGGEL